MAARELKRAKKWKWGEGEGKEGNLSFLSSPPLPAPLLTPFFARSLTLVPRSLLLNRTETLATQAISRTCSDFYVDDPSQTFWLSKDAILERKARLMRHCWSYEAFRTETETRLRLLLCEKVFLMRVSATTKRRFWSEDIACVNFLATEVIFLSPLSFTKIDLQFLRLACLFTSLKGDWTF